MKIGVPDWLELDGSKVEEIGGGQCHESFRVVSAELPAYTISEPAELHSPDLRFEPAELDAQGKIANTGANGDGR